MTSNYRSHIEWEYRDTLTKIEKLKPVSRRAESNWECAKNATREAQDALIFAQGKEQAAKETFRIIHAELSMLKQSVGEYETELFHFDEQWQDWHQ